MAEELREIMADLGFRTINEMVGRVQFLKVKDHLESWKAKKVDLSGILHPVTIRRHDYFTTAKTGSWYGRDT
jgi:glutamate synthase (NADPH/NADH) large chain